MSTTDPHPEVQAGAPPEQTAPEGATQPSLEQQISDMQRKLSELEGKASTGQLTLAQQDDELARKVQDKRSEYEDWPQRGDERAQPWDFRAHELPQPGVTRDYLPGGQADELSPVLISHNKGLLAPGMAGDQVEELAQLLAAVGYPTSVSKGANHTYSFDDSVTAAVAAFKRDYGAHEDPSAFPAQHDHHNYVGPWLWEALIRAAKRAAKAVA